MKKGVYHNLLIALVIVCVGSTTFFGRKMVEQKIKLAFPIRYVRIWGVAQYLDKNEVRAILQPLVSTDFFSVDVQALQTAVVNLPWMRMVAVKRIWPDTIDIEVHEKKAYARWGQHNLLTERGDIFTPKNIGEFKHLVMVTGPEQQKDKVLEVMKGIQTALSDQSMELAEFTISERWAWHIRLKSGMQILMGRDQPLKKLQRFLKTVPILGHDRINEIDIVDLRYTNGYAVSWKPNINELGWQNPVQTETN